MSQNESAGLDSSKLFARIFELEVQLSEARADLSASRKSRNEICHEATGLRARLSEALARADVAEGERDRLMAGGLEVAEKLRAERDALKTEKAEWDRMNDMFNGGPRAIAREMGQVLQMRELRAERDALKAKVEELEKSCPFCADGVLSKRLKDAEAERDAYKKVKEENDERFMRERDEARAQAREADERIDQMRVVLVEERTRTEKAEQDHLRFVNEHSFDAFTALRAKRDAFKQRVEEVEGQYLRALDERDESNVRAAALRSALEQADTALKSLATAVNEGEGWHDENEDCPEDDTCGCKLPEQVNRVLNVVCDVLLSYPPSPAPEGSK